jgi:predicted phosphodiesterase
MLAVCYVGGVAATNLSQTTIETKHYSATVRLSVVPLRAPVLHGPTVLGDLDLQFTSPFVAPGIEVGVSVKQNITEVFSGRNLSVRSLQPTNEEISEALRQGIVGVGWRFLAGGGTAALVLSLAVHYARGHRRPGRQHLITVGTTMSVACAATGLGIWLTYRPANFDSFRTTGLLYELEQNRDVLQNVEARGSQATPYILNLLALSRSLRENLVPPQVNQTVSSRVLLVSDIHGENQYGLMKSIVTDQKIDAVIDLGDLVNFGSVTEADTAGVFTGIESLGVPYLFVGGNHDFASVTDRALLGRLAEVPNVVLLQPGNDAYTAYTLKGLRITGFNDPRYFGDDARNTAEKQRPAVDAFNRAMKDQPVPDLVVAHEPAAAEGVEKADVTLNGHLHSARLEGSRVAVGTFTGGGVVSHYVTEGDSGELRGQPYAFDIAAFGPTCELASLTRYTFRNLVEGAPVYDNVTVINGATIEKPTNPPDSSRSCSSIAPSGRETIPADVPNG